MSDEPELSEDERAAVRAWLRERDQLKAQGRLLLALGLSVSGFIGWLWGDEVKAFLKRVLA